MDRTTLVFPVLAGGTFADVRRIADTFQADPAFIDFNQPVPGVTEIFDSSTLPG